MAKTQQDRKPVPQKIKDEFREGITTKIDPKKPGDKNQRSELGDQKNRQGKE